MSSNTKHILKIYAPTSKYNNYNIDQQAIRSENILKSSSAHKKQNIIEENHWYIGNIIPPISFVINEHNNQ